MNERKPAHKADVWYRILTHKDNAKNGKVHHSAFTGKNVFTLRETAPMGTDLSGRLLSYSGSCKDIKTFGEARAKEIADKVEAKLGKVPSYIRFVGVAAASACELRKWADLPCDAIYEPEPKDTAHANLAFTSVEPGHFTDNDIKRALALKLALLEADHLAPVFSLPWSASGKNP